MLGFSLYEACCPNEKPKLTKTQKGRSEAAPHNKINCASKLRPYFRGKIFVASSCCARPKRWLRALRVLRFPLRQAQGTLLLYTAGGWACRSPAPTKTQINKKKTQRSCIPRQNKLRFKFINATQGKYSKILWRWDNLMVKINGLIKMLLPLQF